MSYRLLQAAVACSTSLAVSAAMAAEISHESVGNGSGGIIIEGPITSGDLEKFRQISVRYKRAIVLLNSDGGALLPAIEIGKIIKIAGFATVVPDGRVCASSCALIWIAGSPRWLAPKGRVGFHASYRDNKGRLEESGVANALIGNYLTLMNLPERAIIFATTASPNEISWLTNRNKSTAGIDFDVWGPDEKKQKPPMNEVAKPITPPPVSFPMPADHPPTPLYGPNWILFGRDQYNQTYYYDRRSLVHSKDSTKVWYTLNFPPTNKSKYKEIKSLVEYRCSDFSSRELGKVYISQEGSILSSDIVPTSEMSERYHPFIPLVPGNDVTTRLGETLCKN